MREFRDLREMQLFSWRARCHGKKVGFVPTMGALHEGHLSLVAEARKRADVVVVSIFVNPLQFEPGEDFARYPRDLKKDKELLRESGIDALFLPETAALFPRGFQTSVEVAELSRKMCGRSRPTHFRGVATIVAKLLNIVSPDYAFFGEKDWQQQLVIKRLVRDLNLPAEIVTLPIVREYDGLAMSSRNAYLKPRERKAAAVLYRALILARREAARGVKDARRILARMRALIKREPAVRLDYLVAVDPATLVDVPTVKGPVLFALAAYLGKARLIDNMLVKSG
jgi:pantoate--beta-alanine ligase